MEQVVFKCRRHGERTEEQVYRSNDKSTILGFRYKCKECTYAATSNRPCKIHGQISAEERLGSGRCKICSLTALKELNDIRNKDRVSYNEKLRLKQEENPEHWANKYKKAHGYKEELHSIESLTERRVANRRRITHAMLNQMFINQDNKCAICRRPETRLSNSIGEGKIRISRLCLDHDHKTGKIRELLCHACNTAIGKFEDNIDFLQAAIDYLKKHE